MVRNVHLPGPEECELGGAVLDEEPLHLVEVRQAPGVVGGIAREDRLHPGLVPLEHERPAADQGLGGLEIAEPVLYLRRQDRAPGLGQAVDERGEGIRQVDAHRARVGRVDLFHRAEERRVGRLPERALDRVLHVGGDQLARVDGRTRLPADAGAQRDRVGPAVRGHPGRQREVRRQREVGRPVPGPVDELEERSTHERRGELGLVGRGGVDVEGGRVEADLLQHAAPDGPPLRPRPARSRRGGPGARGDREEPATRDHGRGSQWLSSRRLQRPPVRSSTERAA